MKEIYLAGGCFWGVEGYYQLLKGVLKTKVGYANGNTKNPTYNDLIQKRATHAETVYVLYDEQIISLSTLLDHYFRFIDPFSINKQGADVGIQYRSGIYYVNATDAQVIKDYLEYFEKKQGKKVSIEALPLVHFYDAEEAHQNYLLKNPYGYCHIDLGLIKEEEKK